MSAFSFINNLSNRASDGTVRSFLSALHHIHPLVEEANVITREVFGNSDLHLEIHTLTDVLDFQNAAKLNLFLNLLLYNITISIYFFFEEDNKSNTK